MAVAFRRRRRETVRGPGKALVRLKVNGGDFSVLVEPHRALLDVLRDDLHFTGTKKGCNSGECGACTVLIDGKAACACLVLAIECEGRDILTIEGLSRGPDLDPVQRAFIENGDHLCGSYTPGQAKSARALPERQAQSR